MESIELSMSYGHNQIGDITNNQSHYWEENIINVDLNDSNGFDSSNDEFSLDNKSNEISILKSNNVSVNWRYQKPKEERIKSRDISNISKSKKNESWNL